MAHAHPFGSTFMKFDVSADHLVGLIKTFDAVGPAYEGLAPIRALEHGDRTMRIQVLESGEVLEYRAAGIADDPKAV